MTGSLCEWPVECTEEAIFAWPSPTRAVPLCEEHMGMFFQLLRTGGTLRVREVTDKKKELVNSEILKAVTTQSKPYEDISIKALGE